MAVVNADAAADVGAGLATTASIVVGTASASASSWEAEESRPDVEAEPDPEPTNAAAVVDAASAGDVGSSAATVAELRDVALAGAGCAAGWVTAVAAVTAVVAILAAVGTEIRPESSLTAVVLAAIVPMDRDVEVLAIVATDRLAVEEIAVRGDCDTSRGLAGVWLAGCAVAVGRIGCESVAGTATVGAKRCVGKSPETSAVSGSAGSGKALATSSTTFCGVTVVAAGKTAVCDPLVTTA
jgi:hypothetical protein